MGEVPKGRRGLPLKLLTSSSTITPATFGGHPSTANAVPLPSKEGRLGCWLYLPHLWGRWRAKRDGEGFSLKLLPPFSANIKPLRGHPPTRGEACHWILSRLRLPTARLSATHNNLRVASLLQIVFAAVTPVPLPPQAVPPPSKEGGLKLDYRYGCTVNISLFTPFSK
jgi:hypothetical protein